MQGIRVVEGLVFWVKGLRSKLLKGGYLRKYVLGIFRGILGV